MNASELKYQHMRLHPDSHFFDRKTMQFFGDTMRNYGVTRHASGCWELYRKRPVKYGLQSSAYFDPETFEQRWPQ